LERNWLRWKGKRRQERNNKEQEKERIIEETSEEWDKENKLGDLRDPYDEL